MTIKKQQDEDDTNTTTKRNDEDEFTLPTIDGIEFVNYINEEQLDDVMRLVGQDLSEPYSVFTYRYFLHRWPQLCILAVPTDDDDDDANKTTEGVGENRRQRRPIGCVVCKIDMEDGETEDIITLEQEQTSNHNDNGTSESSDGEHPNKNESQPSNNNNANNNDGTQFTGYIGMLAVEKTHRRSGIGTVLVQRAIHRMAQLGCHSIKLETEVTNKGAMNLYEDRLGFVREELLKKYYLNWGDAYRLRLWITGGR